MQNLSPTKEIDNPSSLIVPGNATTQQHITQSIKNLPSYHKKKINNSSILCAEKIDDLPVEKEVCVPEPTKYDQESLPNSFSLLKLDNGLITKELTENYKGTKSYFVFQAKIYNFYKETIINCSYCSYIIKEKLRTLLIGFINTSLNLDNSTIKNKILDFKKNREIFNKKYIDLAKKDYNDAKELDQKLTNFLNYLKGNSVAAAISSLPKNVEVNFTSDEVDIMNSILKSYKINDSLLFTKDHLVPQTTINNLKYFAITDPEQLENLDGTNKNRLMHQFSEEELKKVKISKDIINNHKNFQILPRVHHAVKNSFDKVELGKRKRSYNPEQTIRKYESKVDKESNRILIAKGLDKKDKLMDHQLSNVT